MDAPGALVPGIERRGGHVSEVQRHRILLAATEIAAWEGAQAATVSHICARARVSRRTLYLLFADREACLLAALERGLGRIGERVLPAYADSSDWCDRTRAALTALLELLDEEPAVARLCVVEALGLGQPVLERRQLVLDALARALDEDGRRGTRGAAAKSDAVRSPLTAEGVVGATLAVIHARLVACRPEPLVELASPLMATIVLPYRGFAAARRELERPAVPPSERASSHRPAELRLRAEPFKDLRIRITHRTALTLAAIALEPGASNREIARSAQIADQGQVSRLLARLQQAGLIESRSRGRPGGEANAWTLTEHGQALYEALDIAAPGEIGLTVPHKNTLYVR